MRMAPKNVTVKDLIAELQKLPQEANVFAVVTMHHHGSGGEIEILHHYKPAHAHLHEGGDVHVLGLLADVEL